MNEIAKPQPFNVERPWGGFREFVENTQSTVKILFVKKGETFSRQKHNHRGEFWRILKGTPMVTLGGEIFESKAGDEFFIPVEVDHRIAAPYDDVEVLEISLGDFDEKDIVRIEDKYGRS